MTLQIRLSGMNRKTHRGKLTARSPERLKSDIRAWVGAIGDRHFEMGRKLSLEDAIATMILDFMALDMPERESRLSRRLAELRSLYEAETTTAGPKAQIPTSQAPPGESYGEIREAQRKGRKKRGA